MSRPFSYNDENFTTIGNLLIIHFRDDEAQAPFSPVILIPPSIYERMVTNSFMLSAQLVGTTKDSELFAGSTTPTANGAFISFSKGTAKSTVPRYYIGFSMLKDI